MGVRVLSLFDGMACGFISFKQLGIDVDKYQAYEIDKNAIKVSSHNFPKIIHHGDVFKGNFTDYKDYDYLIGGSPCTYWSIAQSPDRRETTASGLGWELFSQYVRALNEAEPKYFLYENNKSMSRDIYNSISKTFGFEPIMINAALVSAQNRQRYYWVGKRNDDGTYSKVDIKQPEDRGILLRDILDGMTDREKGRAVIGSTGRTTTREYFKKSQGNMAYEPVKELSEREMAYMVRETKPTFDGRWNYCQRPGQDDKSKCLVANVSKGVPYNVVAEPVVCGVAQRGRYKNAHDTEQHIEARDDQKANCITTVSKDSMICQEVDLSPKRCFTLPRLDGKQTQSKQYRVYEVNGKSTTLCAEGGGMGAKTGLYAIPVEFENGMPTKAISEIDGKIYTVYRVVDGKISIKGKDYPIKLVDGFYIIRKLTVSECKKLQTVPDWFEFPVSDTQAYKCLGNGWCCEVIIHLLRATIDNDCVGGNQNKGT